MIECPPGWHAIRVSDGLRLLSNATPSPGEIRYRFRHPIEPLEELFARKLAQPGFVVESIAPPEPLTTDEGEYAQLMSFRGQLDGKAVQRTVGMVFGDDYYALLLAVVVDPARFDEMTALIRTLLSSDQQMLGIERRRRFRYAAPLGWHKQQWDFDAIWTRPEQRNVSLTLLPAIPSQGASDLVVAELVQQYLHREFVVTSADGPRPATSHNGLAGQRWLLAGQLNGVQSVRDIVVLRDDRFIYCARLETEGATDASVRAQFDALVSSIEPIPRPRMRTVLDLNALKYWVDN